MAQLVVVLLALFGQMERTYALERAAHARAVAPRQATGSAARRWWIRTKVAYAAHLREAGNTVVEIVEPEGMNQS